MKALVPLAAVLAIRLTLACGAWAQDAAAAVRPVPPRLEVAGAVGAIWFTPTIGILASVPASGGTSLEGGLHLTPPYLIAQGQMRVRLPFGPPGGARRSLIVGLTHLSQRTTAHGVLETGVAAHGGLSAQAPVSRHVDVRADVQMIVPFRDGPGADPRATVAVVWHP